MRGKVKLYLDKNLDVYIYLNWHTHLLFLKMTRAGSLLATASFFYLVHPKNNFTYVCIMCASTIPPNHPAKETQSIVERHPTPKIVFSVNFGPQIAVGILI